jgi:hypothetical protein
VESSTSSTLERTSDESGGGGGVEFCAVFQGLSARREQQQDGFTRYTDEAA